MNANKPAGIGA